MAWHGRFGVTEDQIMNKIMNSNYRELIKFEIARARKYFDRAEEGIKMLSPDARLPVREACRLPLACRFLSLSVCVCEREMGRGVPSLPAACLSGFSLARALNGTHATTHHHEMGPHRCGRRWTCTGRSWT